MCSCYGIQANLDWRQTLGSERYQYEATFPMSWAVQALSSPADPAGNPLGNT
jgi:hypothetical protein